jgi:hypothetical protein
MKPIPSDTWSRLSEGNLEGKMLWTRLAAPDVSDKLLAAVDASGARHLLIHLDRESDELEDSESRGVGVTTRELLAPGAKRGRYLDIVCRDPNSHGIFDIIGGELADGLTAQASPVSLVKGTLTKWRRFWSQIPLRILSIEEQIGLFGELWFLKHWIFPRVGVAEGVERWRGPFGARHDFEWMGTSIEVKATQSTVGPIHWINGLDQLAPPETGRLFLYSVRVREEGGADNSLNQLIKALEEELSEHDQAWTKFESALVQRGYVAAYEDEYAKLKLRIADEGLFDVRDEFPRITSENLVGGSPAGVGRVDYQINLSGFERYRVAQQSSDSAVVAILSVI